MKLVYKDSGHDVLVGDGISYRGVGAVVSNFRAPYMGVEDNVQIYLDNAEWLTRPAAKFGMRWVEENADLSTPRSQWPFKAGGRFVIAGGLKACVLDLATPFAHRGQEMSRFRPVQAVPVHPLDGEPDTRLPAQRVAFNATDYIGFSEEQIALIRRGFMAALDQCWELEKQERNFK